MSDAAREDRREPGLEEESQEEEQFPEET